MSLESIFSLFSSNGVLLLFALLLDRFLGDPIYPFHPVRIMGLLSEKIENKIRVLTGNIGIAGLVHLLLMLFLTALLPLLLLNQIKFYSLGFAWGLELFLVFSLIAYGDLKKHGLQVLVANQKNDLGAIKEKTSFLVSRNLDQATTEDCNRATIESIAENLVDGFFTPLLAYVFFGIEGLLVFKVISTLDSMVGYKNEKYHYFGFWAAKADDILNYIPARTFPLLLAAAALMTPKANHTQTLKTCKTDRHKHASPNSGWAEAAASGALGIRLGGPVIRGGQMVSEPWIGEDFPKRANTDDLKKLINLADHCWLLCFIGVLLFYLLV